MLMSSQAMSKGLSSQMQALQQQVTDSLAAANQAHHERQALTEHLQQVLTAKLQAAHTVHQF